MAVDSPMDEVRPPRKGKDRLDDRIRQKQFEDALAEYIDLRPTLGLWERKVYWHAVKDGLDGQKGHGKVIAAMVLIVITNLLFNRFVSVPLLDMLSVFAPSYIYTNYLCALLPPVLNIVLVLNLTLCFSVEVSLAAKVKKERLPIWLTVCFWVLLIAVSVPTVRTLIPLGADLPTVLSGEHSTYVLSYDDTIALNLKDPRTPWLLPQTVSGQTVYDIYIDGEYYRMSKLQYSNNYAFAFEKNEYPIRIHYLPNAKLVLRIQRGVVYSP